MRMHDGAPVQMMTCSGEPCGQPVGVDACGGKTISELPACVRKAWETGEMVVTREPERECQDCVLRKEQSRTIVLTTRMVSGETTYGVLAFTMVENEAPTRK